MKTNRDIKNFVLKHTIYITSFSSSSPKRYQCNSTLSSSFLVLHVHHGTDTDVSFLTPSNEALGFYVLDEASKESKLIADYHIFLKWDGRLTSRESCITFCWLIWHVCPVRQKLTAYQHRGMHRKALARVVILEKPNSVFQPSWISLPLQVSFMVFDILVEFHSVSKKVEVE